jgi:TRAP-type mannitol/chloroaromatic compound transport system permease large subunit
MLVYLIPISVATASASVAVLYWGWHLGGDGMPFARSGAFVTAISVAFLFFQYGRILAENQKTIGEKVRSTIAAMKLSEEEARIELRFIDEQVELDSKLTELVILIFQGSIIFVGTLVWGFGDLVYQYKTLPWSEIFFKLVHFGGQNSVL